jgi:hypothetical protein
MLVLPLPPLPLAPAAAATAGSDFDSPQALASSAEANVTNEILNKMREFFILVDSLGRGAAPRAGLKKRQAATEALFGARSDVRTLPEATM